LVEAGGFEFLSVVATSRYGAFLDWGLPKDLLVPFSEQKTKMRMGNAYLVHVYVDNITNRVVASAKLEKFLNNTPPPYKNGDEVEILVGEETDLGFKVIVENEYWGIIYRNQLFNDVKPGQRKKAFVSKVRDDDKIDILLEKPGYQKIDSISERVLIVLKENNGFLAVNDKSSPAMIQALFGISKKNFKMAVGNLYKKKIIIFKSDGIAII
jgi:predicted RNA-binding protein (virulence factor B family)